MEGHAICPYCEFPVMVAGIEFGDSIMHPSCYHDIQTEMELLDGQIDEEREVDLATHSEVEVIPF
jgi:hypothetical protein